MIGRIIKIISDDYTVLSENKEYTCKARGRFRNDNITPLVGDMVEFDNKENYILKILKRKNELLRPPVSNIDQAFIITSTKKPDFSSNLLDKLLCIIEFTSIKPIICFTKLDLLNEKELVEINEIVSYYNKIGYDTYLNTETELIKKVFKDKISVFTGQSGAGKSTLLNYLDTSLNLKTDEISEALGRGKHTTRHVELIPLYEGLVADTPGFSSLDFNGMTKEDVRDNFTEFNDYKEGCEYRSCMHNLEPNCEIKKQVKLGNILESRYENYIKFINSIKESKY